MRLRIKGKANGLFWYSVGILSNLVDHWLRHRHHSSHYAYSKWSVQFNEPTLLSLKYQNSSDIKTNASIF